MRRSGETVLPWGDADRTFRLGIGEWRKIQEACDAGPAEIAQRLSTAIAFRRAHPLMSIYEMIAAGALGAWRVDDVREPLYRGLIGGGMTPTEAGKLVRELFDERPLLENIDLALAVVLGSLLAPDDEPLGESEGEAATTGSPEASSPLPTSTAPAPSSAGPPNKSMPVPSGSSSSPGAAG